MKLKPMILDIHFISSSNKWAGFEFNLQFLLATRWLYKQFPQIEINQRGNITHFWNLEGKYTWLRYWSEEINTALEIIVKMQ